MIIAFLSVTAIIFLWLTFMWSTNGGLNCLIKVIFVVMTFWSGGLLIGVLSPQVAQTGMRLF